MIHYREGAKKTLIISFILLYTLSLVSINSVGSEEKIDESIGSSIPDDDDVTEPISINRNPEKIDDHYETKPIKNSIKSSEDLIKHGPIYVNGNNNFVSTAEREGWKGDGTKEDPFIIENYDIDARGAGNAIMISNTDLHFVIRNCMVYNAAWLSNPYLAGEGIAMYNSSNGSIINNTAFSNDGDGIDLQIAKNVKVYNNEATSNYDDGIHLTDSENILVYNNTVSTNDDDGIYIEGRSNNNIIRNNVINLNAKYSISLMYSYEITMRDNSIIKSKAGVVSSHSHNLKINHNDINDAEYGVYLLNTNKTRVNDNRISQGDYGIYTSSSDNNDITNNSVMGSQFTGITFTFSSDENYVNNNTLSANNQNGFYITSSNDNKLFNNTIYSNRWIGILMYDSDSNILRYNNISYNNIGIDLRESSKNLIYNNNFIENNQQVSARKSNIWDDGYPVGGNYWSNYKGSDFMRGPEQDLEGSDGIGDSPYWIYSDVNKDNYPLMNPIKSSSEITSPSQPQNLRVVSGDGFVALDWSIPEDNGGSPLTGYNIYRGLSSENITFYKSTKNIETTFEDYDVKNNVTYFYYVTAMNSLGESNKTVTVSGTPEIEKIPPNPPQNLTAEFDRNDTIILRWDSPIKNISVAHYHIYRGIMSDEKVRINTVSGRTFHYKDRNIENNITYYYQVSAENSAGESNLSEEAVVNIEPVFLTPSSPVDVKISEGDRNITIDWSPPENDGGKKVLGYKIYRSESNSDEKLIVTVTGKATYVDSNISFYKTYNYRISAFNEVGEGKLSDEVSGRIVYEGSIRGDEGGFLESNWFLYPILIIVMMLIIARIFVIKPIIKAQR